MLERKCIAFHHVGIFVLLHADTVARAMNEVFAIACIVEHTSGGPVDVLARCSDRAGRHPRSIRCHERVVHLRELRRRLTGVHTASDVGAVSRHRATEIAQHDLPRLDDPRTRMMVTRRRVWSRSHDRKVHLVVTLGDDATRNVSRNISLGTPDERDLAALQLQRNTINREARRSERIHFGIVFAHTNRARDMARLAPQRVRQLGLQVDHERRPATVADRDVASAADHVRNDLGGRLQFRPRTNRK